MGHVGQDVELNGTPELLVQIHDALDAEDQEAAVLDIGVAVEEAALGAHAHRVQPQADPLEDLLSVQGLSRGIVIAVFLHAKLEQILHNGVIRGLQPGEIRCFRQAEFLVQPGHHDLDGIHFHIGKVLIAAEPVLEECQMLADAAASAEGFRRIRILHRFAGPGFGFQEIDHVPAIQKIQITAAVALGQGLHFALRIHAKDPLPGFPEIGDQQLQQVAFAHAGVAQDQGISRGLVIGPAVQIHDDVRAELVPSDVKPMGIRLAGEVEGIHIGHGAGRQHPFKLRAEHVPAKGHHRQEALLLPQGQQIQRQLSLGHFHVDVRLEGFQCLHAFGFQLQKHRTVEQRLPFPLQMGQQLADVQQILLCLDRFIDIGVSQLQPVLPVGVVRDLVVLTGLDDAVVRPEGHAAVICQVGQDRLLLGAGGILPDRPHTAVAVTHNVVAWEKPNRGRTDAVEEGFRLLRCQLLRGLNFLPKQPHPIPPVHTDRHLHPAACRRP